MVVIEQHIFDNLLLLLHCVDWELSQPNIVGKTEIRKNISNIFKKPIRQDFIETLNVQAFARGTPLEYQVEKGDVILVWIARLGFIKRGLKRVDAVLSAQYVFGTEFRMQLLVQIELLTLRLALALSLDLLEANEEVLLFGFVVLISSLAAEFSSFLRHGYKNTRLTLDNDVKLISVIISIENLITLVVELEPQSFRNELEVLAAELIELL